MNFDLIPVLGLVGQIVSLLSLVEILSSRLGLRLVLLILYLATVLALGRDAMRSYSLVLGLDSVLIYLLALLLLTMANLGSLNPGHSLVLIFRDSSID